MKPIRFVFQLAACLWLAGCAHLACSPSETPFLEARHSSNGGAIEMKVYSSGCATRQVVDFGARPRQFRRRYDLRPWEIAALHEAIRETAFLDLPSQITSKFVIINGEYRDMTARDGLREHSVTLDFPQWTTASGEAARFLTVWSALLDIIASYE